MEQTVYTQEEAMQFISENDVRFVKLFFTDVFGVIKSISIQPSELERAFTDGIAFDASSEDGFLNYSESDLFIFPDASTLCVLPWRPQSGRVVRFFCSIKCADGSNFEGDSRQILQNFVEKQKNQGIEFEIGSECEFYLFKLDELGNPTDIPFDSAGYCDLAPLDKCENVRREICLTLEQMGVHPQTSHHESGPGQNEVVFCRSNPLSAADNLQTFKIVVKTIAAKNGLFATFFPKPLDSKAGNGLHINVSVSENQNALLTNEEISPKMQSFVAGLLSRASEISPFVNPLDYSYRRLGTFEAPAFLNWSRKNCNPLVRLPFSKNGDSKIEFRSPDSSANPYLAIYLILASGIDGVCKNSTLPDAIDLDFSKMSFEQQQKIKQLPSSLHEARILAAKSEFVKNAVPLSICKAFKISENDNF